MQRFILPFLLIISVSFVGIILSMRNLLLIVVVLFAIGCKNAHKNGYGHATRVLKPSIGWDSVGSGIKGTVNALAVYKGNLYAGGGIDSAGGMPIHGIAMWDGSKWHSVGSGIRGNVNALIVYKDELYAGGYFDSAGGKPYSCIAKWNGIKWSDVDTINDVIALATFNNRLYATGFNDSADNRTTHTIGTWDGKEWDSISNPDKRWELRSLCPYNNNLYAGGRVGKDSSLVVLGKYGWAIVGKSFPFEISTMLEYKNELYLAGGDASGNSSTHIMKWNGKAWGKPGAGLKGQIKSLAIYNNRLYTGGQFARVNGVYTGCIASWDDTAWAASGGGINLKSVELEKICPVNEANLVVYVDTTPNKRGMIYYDTLFANLSVNAMLEYKGQLYIAGKFDYAGGVPSQNIARYKDPAKQN